MIAVEIINKIMIEKGLLIMCIEGEMKKVVVLKMPDLKNVEDHLKIMKEMNIHQKLIYMIKIKIMITITEGTLKKHIKKENVQRVERAIHNMNQNIIKNEIITINIKNLIEKDIMNQEKMITVNISK